LHTALKPSSVSTKFGSKYSHTLDLLTRVGVESSELSEVFVEVAYGKNNINLARDGYTTNQLYNSSSRS
jgi:hypothetical protein